MITQSDARSQGCPEAAVPVFRAYQGGAGLETLTPEWNALARSIPGTRFLHFPCWYRAYLSSGRCEASDVWFVAAYRGPQLIAVFPLQMQRHRVALLKPRLLGTIEDDELQLSDFIFEARSENAGLIDALTRWLRRERRLRWDVLRLLKIPGDSSIAYALRLRAPRILLSLEYDASAYFDTSGSYEQATRAMTSKFKSNLRRRSRLAESTAKLRFQSCREQDELAPAFQTFLEIEASGWKGPAGTSSAILCRPQVLAFYTAMVQEFAARDECVINILWHGERPVAAQLGLFIGRTLHILKVAYCDSSALFAPGILLQERTLRHACDDPDVDVLSMVNDPYWARSFRPQTVGVSVHWTPNWTIRGLLTIVGLTGKRLVKRLLPPAAESPGDEGQGQG